MSLCKNIILKSLIIFILLRCSDDSPLFPTNHRIEMNIDEEVTSVWIELLVNGWDNSAAYFIERDDSIIFQGLLKENKMILRDSGLISKRTYTYKAYARKEGQISGQIQCTVTTLDTTNHYINWEVFEFGGEVGSNYSIFLDVEIINNNDIWVVGYISTNDDNYNAAHWDGTTWELKKIYFLTWCNQTDVGVYPANTIIAFGENDLWISHGSKITRILDYEQLHFDCINISVNKFWGTDNRNFYAVGELGNIAYCSGQDWTKIESGTDIPLLDVYGIDNDIIWMSGFSDSDGSILIRKINNELTHLIKIEKPMEPDPGRINQRFESIWTDKKNWIYLGADGRIYKMYYDNTLIINELIWWDYNNGLPPPTKIVRGTGFNDLYIAGKLGLLRHFNGSTWKQYEELNSNIDWYGMDVSENVVAVAGLANTFPTTAVIAIGKK